MMKLFYFAIFRRAQTGVKHISDKTIYEVAKLVNNEKRGFDINGMLKKQGAIGVSNLRFEKIPAF